MYEVFAYLDPSTGSLFIQATIGLLAGGAFIFRTTAVKVIGRVSAFVKRDSAE